MSRIESNPEGIDWSAFDGDPELTCECACGRSFRSHAKYLARLHRTVSRKACPGCGAYTNLVGVSGDWERWSLRG